MNCKRCKIKTGCVVCPTVCGSKTEKSKGQKLVDALLSLIEPEYELDCSEIVEVVDDSKKQAEHTRS